MSPETIQILVTLTGGLFIGGGSIFLLGSRRGKIEADTAESLTASAGKWVDKLEERIDQLEARVKELEEERDHHKAKTLAAERRNGRLNRWITMLESQVMEYGGIPVSLEDIPD